MSSGWWRPPSRPRLLSISFSISLPSFLLLPEKASQHQPSAGKHHILFFVLVVTADGVFRLDLGHVRRSGSGSV